jgi:hypothetical protein
MHELAGTLKCALLNNNILCFKTTYLLYSSCVGAGSEQEREVDDKSNKNTFETQKYPMNWNTISA